MLRSDIKLIQIEGKTEQVILLINNSGTGGMQGLESLFTLSLNENIQLVLRILYPDRLSKAERGARIKAAYEAGTRISDLAREYNITPQRVWQILRE